MTDAVTTLRLRLRATGFSPIPAEGKAPHMDGWQEKLNTTDAEIKLWPKTWHLAHNTGIIAKFTPGLDIDILDEDAAEAMEHLAREHFEEHGKITLRIGLWPKRLIPLRTDEPFAKLRRVFRAPDGTEHKIEVLCDGQQWVAFGVHPDTKAPYRWTHGEPGNDFARDELPYVRLADVVQYLDAAETLLIEQHGFTLVTGLSQLNGGEPHEPGGEPLAPSSRVAASVRVIPNDDVGWDDWNRVGMAIWAATNGSTEGFEIFDKWSQKSRKHDAGTTSKKWSGYVRSPPTRIGFGTLKYLADQADPAWEDALQPQPETAPQFSDEALALLFSARHANDLRYVAPWNRWLHYNGKRWEFEETLQTFDAARKLCRELAAQCNKQGTAKAIASAKTVAAVVTLARADRRQAATVAQWDADPWLLGTTDGTIDLRTGILQRPKLDNYITKIVRTTPAGDCPQWLGFLDLVTNHDTELQSYLQRVCGYGLTGVTSEHQFFFYYGKGANGKSAYLGTVSGILGDYHRTASMEMFTVTQMERHPTDLAMLRGARLVTAVETEEGKRWDESKLKYLTGGDPIEARFMRQDFFQYVPQFKLMIAGNHKPPIRNVDEAIRRRLRLIPFTFTIPESKRVLNFAEKMLAAEQAGILRWMIDGCLAWQRHGLKPPKVVTAATESYVDSQDDLQAFIDQCCVVEPKESDTVEHLWDGWVDWAQDCNEFIGSKRRFSDRLAAKDYERTTGGADKTRMFKGIRCIRENAKKQAAEARKRADEARSSQWRF